MIEANVVHFKTILVRAQHIIDACEHVRGTGVPYVGLLFVGEDCIGVDTDPRITMPVTEREPSSPPLAPSSPPLAPSSPPIPSPIETPSHERHPSSAIQALSPEGVFAVLREHGPLSSREVSDQLGISRKDDVTRQRVVRILKGLVTNLLIAKENPLERYPRYTISAKDTPRVFDLSRPRPRTRKTNHHHAVPSSEITIDRVVQILAERKRATSMAISDEIGIPRKDGSMRGKVSLILKQLREEQRIKVAEQENGYSVYELVG